MAKDALASALCSNDLDIALKTIMDALGIKTGDVAGVYFSAKDRETYRGLVGRHDRAGFIRSWVCAELDDAAGRTNRS